MTGTYDKDGKIETICFNKDEQFIITGTDLLYLYNEAADILENNQLNRRAWDVESAIRIQKFLIDLLVKGGFNWK